MIDAKSSARVTTLLATMTTLAGLVGACTGDEPEPTPRVCISVTDPVTMNAGTFGHKPKIQRTGNGTLVAVYGDAPDGAGMVYDVKGDYERPARDIFVRTCKPDANKSCNAPEHWSAPLNISNSATVSSMETAWQGGDPVAQRMEFAGDIDKPNVKTSGPVLVLTWNSAYCPDGDLSTPEIDPPVQRAVRYLERDDRVIPFSCMWVATSVNHGVVWSAPKQLTTGERDAKQDASAGSYDSEKKIVQAIISWQEDPEGLQLGEADGPGDGASGANVTGGTDVWYTHATFTVTTPDNNTLPWAEPVRLTDNFQGKYGLSGQQNPIFAGTGENVPEDMIEKGQAGASRANIGKVGGTAIVAYEETKGSEGLDSGKFIRYHAFPYASPPSDPAGQAGCVISNPTKNARRVRFLTQSPTDAGEGGIQIGIFWKEGIEDKGGPSDVVVRRGMGGLQPASMVPALDPGCATSIYDEAIVLANTAAENLSSQSATATAANLLDDTELNDRENALAHRGVLRGRKMWIGYSYTADLQKLWAQLDNYNFWLREYDVDAGAWTLPRNISNIDDKTINVREPRTVGTPKSGELCPTDPTFCQDPSVVYVAWGTQVNEVGPFDAGGDDLGIYITVSTDAGATFPEPVRLSPEKGILFEDDENAYESQIVTRPDGTRFYAMWANAHLDTGDHHAEFVSGDVTLENEEGVCEEAME